MLNIFTVINVQSCQWRRSGVFLVNFEHILHFALVSIINFEYAIAGCARISTQRPNSAGFPISGCCTDCTNPFYYKQHKINEKREYKTYTLLRSSIVNRHVSLALVADPAT